MRWRTLETVQPLLNLFLTAAEVGEDGAPIRFLRFDSITGAKCEAGVPGLPDGRPPRQIPLWVR
jgi:hypothetical protein